MAFGLDTISAVTNAIIVERDRRAARTLKCCTVATAMTIPRPSMALETILIRFVIAIDTRNSLEIT